MKFLFISLAFLFLNLTASAEWTQQNSQTTSTLNSVNFINAQTGFAAGDNGVIRKTTDGGDNWTIIEIPLPVSFSYVKMFNANNIILVSLSANKVLRSTDGGLIWDTTSTYGISGSLTKVKTQFVNFLTGFIIAGGTCYKTTNGGFNWSARITATGIKDISMLDETIGWMCGTYTSPFPPGVGTRYAEILRTDNGGEGWYVQTSVQEQSFSIDRVFGVTPSIAFYNGFITPSIVRTTDGGSLWSSGSIGAGTYKKYYSHHFPTTTTGWLLGDLMLKSTNSGAAWEAFTTPAGISFKSVFFTDVYTGWFVGTGGKILKTTTGGVVGVNNVSSLTPEVFKLFQNYPNPFNPSTNIKFDIKKKDFAYITVYNSLGNEVAELVNEVLEPGSYNVTFVGNNLSSGIYYCKMQTKDFIETKKMILMK